MIYGLKSDRETATQGVILTKEIEDMEYFPRKGDKISIGPTVNIVDDSMYDIRMGIFVEFVEEALPNSLYEGRLNEHNVGGWRVEERIENGQFTSPVRKETIRNFRRQTTCKDPYDEEI